MTLRTWMLRFGVLLAIVAIVPLASVDRGIAKKGLPTGNENTNVIVQNVGTGPATIVMDVYTPGGVLIPGASQVFTNVPVGGSVTFVQALNTGLAPKFRGVGSVSASEPINAIIVRDILSSASFAAKSYSIANGQSAGASKLALPIAFNELLTADWNSRITVVATGSAIACVKFTYFITTAGSAGGTVVDNPSGQPDCPNGYAVKPGGQLTVTNEPGTIDGGINFPPGTSNHQLAVLVEVTNPGSNVAIAANVDIYRSDGNRLLGSYNGLRYVDAASTADDVGTEIIVPLAIKSTSGFYSVIGVMNLGSSAADVNIEYIGNLADGNGAAQNRTVTLNNVTNAAFHSTYDGGTNVDLGFVGYARITSSQPIAAIVIRGKQTAAFSGVNEAIYTAVNAVPIDQAATKWYLPLVFRRFAPGAAPSFGWNSWIQVQVADGTSANVQIQMVSDPAAGCPGGPFPVSNHVVNGSNVFYMNLEDAAGVFGGAPPSCFWGAATVTADKPVIVIGQVGADKFPGSDSEGLYNAFK